MEERVDYTTTEDTEISSFEDLAGVPGAENLAPDYEDLAEEQAEEVYEEEVRTVVKKKKKKRRKKHYFLRFLLFLAVIVGIIAFLLSDFFAVTEIEVEGNRYYTAAQIIEMSGLQTGNNIFRTKTSNVKGKLMEDPYIKMASTKKVPRDTIRISVTERAEYAVVPYGTEYVLIDSEGMVLRIAETQPTLPLLEGMTITEMTPGNALVTEQSYLLTDTLDLISCMEENDIYFKKVNFSTVVVRAYIYDNLYCEGTPANIKDNMGNIKRLMEELYKDDITRGVIKVGKDNYLSYSPLIIE